MSKGALDSGARVSATANHVTSAVATVTGIALKKIYITDISGSSDKAGARLIVKDGSTAIWQDRISSGGAFAHHFETPIVATIGADASVTVDGTAECNANISGVQL